MKAVLYYNLYVYIYKYIYVIGVNIWSLLSDPNTSFQASPLFFEERKLKKNTYDEGSDLWSTK